jgi:hypothetical protein
MPTLETEILRRYSDLQAVVADNIGDVPLFPKVGDVDAVDVASMIVATFSSQYPGGYRRMIETIATFRGILVTKNQMDEVYPHAEAFIDWIIKTMRERQG